MISYTHWCIHLDDLDGPEQKVGSNRKVIMLFEQINEKITYILSYLIPTNIRKAPMMIIGPRYFWIGVIKNRENTM